MWKSSHHGITHQEMCVVERRADGSLETVFSPISYDQGVLARLSELSSRMKAWEHSRGEQLKGAVRFLVADVVGVDGTNIDSVASHYREVVLDVYRLAGIEAGYARNQITTTHDNRDYPTGIYSLPATAALIRGFDVTREAIEECETHLEEPVRRELEWAHWQASGLRPHLLAALDDYERAFLAYVEEAERIFPKLFERKSFCRNFSGVYTGAELDYTITPGNQCIVESIGEYYWACVLERLYVEYEGTGRIETYSHRRRGFDERRLVLEAGCDLQLMLETNFGYGKVRYFRSTLSYKGVRAINASLLIFFQGANKVAFSEHTFNYEVEEGSFETCFDDAVRIQTEYRNVGEVDFVDKYFRKSLADLSELLLIIANMDTFLQITTLERFVALTSGAGNALIPDEGFRNISFKLSKGEEKLADALAEAVLSVVDVGGMDACANDARIQALPGQIFSQCDPDGLQLIVKKDLVRSRMARGLAPLLAGRYDVGELVKRVIPPDDGIFVETYEGYDLVNMRIEKALAVIGPIQRLREIAALTRFESVIDTIVSTCALIGDQSRSYVANVIDPNLGRIVPERDRVKAQLDGVNAQIMLVGYQGGDTSWLEGQSQNLMATLQRMNGSIAELEKQRRRLVGYVQTVRELQASREAQGNMPRML